ncbi:hypothetical protein R6Q59_015404 [Mikania micrantha]
MAGAVMNPVQANGPVDVNDQSSSPSYYNNLRISTVADRLLARARSGSKNDDIEICRLCVSLSRGIDYAVGNYEIPDRALQLPYLFKKVCQWTDVKHLQPAIMMLMISIKGACRNGWFGEKENEELHSLWKVISTSFCSVGDMNSGESTVHHCISTVMSRFYPRMKMGKILVFIETMPGYRAFVEDFHIAKNAISPNERVYLFVAQSDNTETSSCIISPRLVNFLLNGKAVDRRTCLYQDPGPQIPTPVIALVKYGTNLLQAVGQFNGKYIIVVALMSMITNPSCPLLPDYVPPIAAASDLDNDIVEGPSTISLNCPISFRRITTPVKGYLCKHLQCFDFDNYVDINSRRPSWRCPHCSQSVCFTDIRLDQGMTKVLKEVDVTISHVKISADGSWEAVFEGDGHANKQDKSLSHQEPTHTTYLSGDIMDLTKGDNDINVTNSHKENEKKPSLDQLLDQPNPSDQILGNLNMNHTNTNISPRMENRFFRPTHENGTYDTRSNVSISQGQNVISGSTMQLPAYAIGTSNTVMNPILQGLNQTQISVLSSMNYNHGMRYTTPTRYVVRNPNAVQALSAETPAGMVSGNRQQFPRFQMDQHQRMCMITASMSENTRSQNWVNHDFSNVSIQSAQQFGAHLGPSHQSSGQYLNSHHHQSVNHMIPNLVQSPVQLSPQVHQGVLGSTAGYISNQQTLHYVNTPAPQAPEISSWTPPNPAPQTPQLSNRTPPNPAPQAPQLGNRKPNPAPQAPQLSNRTPSNPAPKAPQISSWTPPVPAQLQTSVSSTPVASSEGQKGLGQATRTQEGSTNASADQSWRPTGRMRGSLSGQAYTDAYNRSIVHPTQPIQAASPPVLNTPRPFIPPHLEVLMTSNINANGFEDGGSFGADS